MSFRYAIQPEDLILVRFEGPVSVAELTASAEAICHDPRYVRGSDGLVDLTKVLVTIPPQDIRRLVDFTLARRKHGSGRWAALVASPLATAYTMLYQRGVSARHPFAVFSTYERASVFLGHAIDQRQLVSALAEYGEAHHHIVTH